MSYRGRRLLVAALLALGLAGSPACAQVSVTFIAPERFTDAENRYGSGVSRRVALAEIRRLFEELGSRVLKPGQSLAIEVLDLDLAGLDAPGLSVPFGPRVVTDITPPRLRLRYALAENGRTVLRAEEVVTDLNYLVRYGGRSTGYPFYYERELIRDWLQRRIVLRRPPVG